MIINTNLEKELNLAPMIVSDDVEESPISEISIVNRATYSTLDKIESALPQVDGLNASDAELDELAEYAITAHKDLLELAMNVEQRFAGEISGAASSMLGHAITARTNKIKKKLDMISLQIKKQLADAKIKENEPGETLPGEVIKLDRNEILDHLFKKSEKP